MGGNITTGGAFSTTGNIYPGTGSALQTTGYITCEADGDFVFTGGKVGIGASPVANCPLDVNGVGVLAVRADGSSGPASGKSVEIFYHSANDVAYLQAFDRTGAAYKPIYLVGSTVTLYSGGNARLLADGTGVKVTSGYTGGTVGALDSYDDAMVLHRGLSQGQAEALLKVGALERHGELLMWDIERTIMLLGGGIYQTRQKHDREIAEVRARLATLEARAS